MTHANYAPLYIGYPTLEAWAGAVKKTNRYTLNLFEQRRFKTCC